MVYTGKVINGVIVLQKGQRLPDGTHVLVEPNDPEGDTLCQRPPRSADTAEDLPPDIAGCQDRCLHSANGAGGVSCYELADRLGLIGAVDKLPSDLSTNPRHLEGLGLD